MFHDSRIRGIKSGEETSRDLWGLGFNHKGDKAGQGDMRENQAIAEHRCTRGRYIKARTRTESANTYEMDGP